MRIIGLSLLLLTLFSMGCSILPDPEDQPIYYFDIGAPETKNQMKEVVKLSTVEFVVCEKTLMSFRDGGNSVRFDEFNRWSDLPSNLLRKHFLLALNNTSSTKPNTLSQGKSLDVYILRFDLDLQKKTANVTALFVIHGTDGRRIFWRTMIEAEKRVKTDSAAGFAEAMGAAVSDLTTRLVAKLNATPPLTPKSEASLKNDKK
jgi:ABC-type uncharacterized transport system auxiliary subunit